MAIALDFRTTNALWCSVLVETLARCGLRQVVISPGSRSTPLTVAFVRHPEIESIPVVDERSAGFLALGLAKQTHRPVALVCTSGTAGANYFPAVIEASESNTPLLVMTADRPPEMRDCASGQTIDQQKLFGGYVRWNHEFAVPGAEIDMLRYARQTIAHAFACAAQGDAGPVHLNLPFRDPLPPLEDGSTTSLQNKLGDDFFSHLGPSLRANETAFLFQRPTTSRGLIVAGPANPENVTEYVRKVLEFAAGTGWPVLADALSPLRHHVTDGGTIIAHYDAILRNETLARDLAPRYVICLEGWPTSRALRAWLEQSQAEILMVSPSKANHDALHGRTRHVRLPVEALRVEGVPVADAAFVAAWRAAQAAAEGSLDAAFAATSAMFEPKAAWLLGRHLPPETPVFVASSMPVRDVEYFWPANNRRHRFYFNRGANGIDGTLSTAVGIAHGNRPAVLLTGDLALLHDSNGLLHRSRLRGSLTIVLINNRGGGIFEHLPISRFDPPFEEFFATPQDVDFAHLCAAHGVAHHKVTDWREFVPLISDLPASGTRVIEIPADRKADAAARKRIMVAASAAAVAGGAPPRAASDSQR